MAGDATAFRCGGRPRGLPAAGLGLSAVVRESEARWGRERRRHDLPDRKGWERIPVSLQFRSRPLSRLAPGDRTGPAAGWLNGRHDIHSWRRSTGRVSPEAAALLGRHSPRSHNGGAYRPRDAHTYSKRISVQWPTSIFLCVVRRLRGLCRTR